jgi:3-hydroxyacyl-CoA dehydrogenase
MTAAYTEHTKRIAQENASAQRRAARIAALAASESLTGQEVEAVLAYLHPSKGYRADHWLAEKVLKRKEAEKAVKYRAARIAALVARVSLTEEEAEAVLARLFPDSGYQKNTLLAFQVINRFARTHEIQNSDAEVVLREYL